jgi:hypothetical protein
MSTSFDGATGEVPVMSSRSPFTLGRSATERDQAATDKRREALLRRIDALPATNVRRRASRLPHVDADAVADAIERLRPTD